MRLTITDNDGDVSPDTFDIDISHEILTTSFLINDIHLKTSLKNYNFLMNIRRSKLTSLTFFIGEQVIKFFGLLIKNMEIDDNDNIDVFFICDHYDILDIKEVRKLKLDKLKEINNEQNREKL